MTVEFARREGTKLTCAANEEILHHSFLREDGPVCSGQDMRDEETPSFKRRRLLEYDRPERSEKGATVSARRNLTLDIDALLSTRGSKRIEENVQSPPQSAC